MARDTLVGWLGTFFQLLIRLSWGVIAVPIALLLKLNSIQIGFVATSFYIGYVAASIPWGLVIDRIGPKRTIALSSSFLFITNLLLFFSPIRDYAFLVLLYLIEGLIASAIFPSAMKIVAITHSSRLTFYVALLESAAPATIILLGLISTLLLNAWKLTFLSLAIAFGLIAVLSALWISVSSKPTEMKRSFKVILDKRIALATLLRFGELWATWGTSTWIFSMLVLYRHISTSLSALFLFIYGIGQLIGILSVERLSWKIGDAKTILANILGFIVMTSLIVITPIVSLYLLEAFFLGVFSFSYRPPTDSLIMKMGGNGREATSIAFANSISQMGTMIAPSFVGLILYLTKSFVFSMLGLNVGMVISLISLILLVKWKTNY
ncbi:MAG: MFS transporter [Sulfolobaceae archaeon]|nr:MFS transporter [Sulfolobaceae archaeon]